LRPINVKGPGRAGPLGQAVENGLSELFQRL
jgi:hypothetical protein